MRLELDAPNIGELEKEYLLKCIDSTFISTFGPFVGEFEARFRERVDAAAAVSVQSGTAAIHLALHDLGVGPGDEVIVPALTFIASVNPVLYVGATPVFVDIDPNTWNLDAERVAEAITPRTRAILAVHLYGNPCDMEALTALSGQFEIPLIEDAAESLGATFDGKETGTFGEMGCYSFNGNKVMTTAGGGMVVSQNTERAEHLAFLVNQARDVKRGYFHPELGFNYRMTNLLASLGLAQLERLDEFLARKRQIFEVYERVLADLACVSFQAELPRAVSNRWLTSLCIRHPRHDIAQIQSALRDCGIPTRRIFMPMNAHPPYQPYATSTYPHAAQVYQEGLNLPSSTLNSVEQTEACAEQVRRVLTT